MATWRGRFVAVEDARGGGFAGHRVTLEFTTGGARGHGTRALASDVLDEKGNFTLDLPPAAQVKPPLVLTLSSRRGQALWRRQLAANALGRRFEAKLAPSRPHAATTGGDAATSAPRRLTGLVIADDGQPLGRAVTVTLWGRPADSAVDASAVALAVVETARGGYFWCAAPTGPFAEAFATVGLGGTAPRVEIGLEASGRLPTDVLLVVPAAEARAAAAAAADTACAGCADDPPRAPEPEDLTTAPDAFSDDLGGGRCVEFTTPDRTIEEFVFLQILRIEDPEITGLRVDDGSDSQPVNPWIAERLAFSVMRDPAVLRAGMVAGAAKKHVTSGSNTAEGTGVVGQAGSTWASRILAYVRRSLGLEPMKDFSGTKSLPAVIAKSLVDARLELPRTMLKRLARDPGAFSFHQLLAAHGEAQRRQIAAATAGSGNPAGGRGALSASNPVDWEGDPEIYQASSVVLGHILGLRQIWRADGYSMGDLLYSLPLAPCEKRKVAIVDWERREQARRSESEAITEDLVAEISRNRAIAETVNATLDESMRGFSIAGARGRGMGAGGSAADGPFSGVAGVSGGYGLAGSYAEQGGNREVAAESLQRLRDRTLQSASAVRNRLATTVVAVEQGETMRLETQVVANHNHCHAMTMQYFEVLRHFQVTQHLDSVQECLFVPLPMTTFDAEKALEWRELLESRVDRRHRGGFDAIERLRAAEALEEPDTSATVRMISGWIELEFDINRPPDQDNWKAAWNKLTSLFTGNPGKPNVIEEDDFESLYKDYEEHPRVWRNQIAPLIAQAFVTNLHMEPSGDGETIFAGLVMVLTDAADRLAPVRPHMATAYVPNKPVRVNYNADGSDVGVALEDFQALKIVSNDALPFGSTVKVRRVAFGYRTDNESGVLVRQRDVNDRLGLGDHVYLPTTVNVDADAEAAAARLEADRQRAEALLRHLNTHLEHYHKVLWWQMDANRRYMLLDGFEAPGAGGRSIASVVDNRVIAIVGNALVMPVSPGIRLDPEAVDDRGRPIDLRTAYGPDLESPRMRVSVPTGGVYAEAVLGACNSCEEIDDTRFWRWSEEPCPDEAPEIAPLSAESRRADPGDLQTAGMPAPIVNIQQPPAAPDPTGLAGAFATLQALGAFRDVTGLTQNQLNAIRALEKSLETAASFGDMATLFRDLGGTEPGSDDSDPDVNEPNVKKPNVKKPSVEKPGVEKPGVKEPGGDDSGDNGGGNGGTVTDDGGTADETGDGSDSTPAAAPNLLTVTLEVGVPDECVRIDPFGFLDAATPPAFDAFLATFTGYVRWATGLEGDPTDDDQGQGIAISGLASAIGFLAQAVGRALPPQVSILLMFMSLMPGDLSSTPGSPQGVSEHYARIRDVQRALLSLLMGMLFPTINVSKATDDLGDARTAAQWAQAKVNLQTDPAAGNPVRPGDIPVMAFTPLDYGFLAFAKDTDGRPWWSCESDDVFWFNDIGAEPAERDLTVRASWQDGGGLHTEFSGSRPILISYDYFVAKAVNRAMLEALKATESLTYAADQLVDGVRQALLQKADSLLGSGSFLDTFAEYLINAHLPDDFDVPRMLIDGYEYLLREVADRLIELRRPTLHFNFQVDLNQVGDTWSAVARGYHSSFPYFEISVSTPAGTDVTQVYWHAPPPQQGPAGLYLSHTGSKHTANVHVSS